MKRTNFELQCYAKYYGECVEKNRSPQLFKRMSYYKIPIPIPILNILISLLFHREKVPEQTFKFNAFSTTFTK